MINQLIYTRCSPHRELKSKGQVTRSDGFGVFSMSPELFSDTRLSNYELLQERLSIPNGAREDSKQGLFNSYEYVRIDPGVYVFSYEVARPRCEIPRANGKGHRSGTFIKQSLIGSIEGYPAEWFGDSVWDAHQKSENDYYLDNDPDEAPAFLSQVSSTPTNGYIDTSAIKAFVSDNRAEAVKAGIWFLLKEFRKPEGERKVLLIKDTPDNVELWIAAIEYGFSAAMAQKISFTTNRSQLDTQADNALFYYTDEGGRFSTRLNRSIPQTRHPYCMITGYHPKDESCVTLRQMPVSNFVIIDGTTKSIGFQPDESIRMPYYSAAVEYEADIQDFCNIVLPGLPITELTGNLPELFDAYKYLLDSDHKSSEWHYANVVHYLNVLLQYGIPTAPALSNYLVGECLKVYRRFGIADEREGYPLLKHMWNIAKAVGRESEVSACVADAVGDGINNITERKNGIRGTWQALNAANMTVILKPALQELFSDAKLMGYVKEFANTDSASVKTLLDMFFYMLKSERTGLAYLMETNERYSFVCMAVVGLLNDKERLIDALRTLKTDPEVFNGVALSVAQYLEKYVPSKIADWWDTIIDICGNGVIELSRKLCDSKTASIEMVERLLANRTARVRKFEPDIGRAFSEAIAKLGKKPDTGRWLFGTWLKVSQPNEFADIINAIKKCAVNKKVEEELFMLVDSRLPYDDIKGVSPALYRAVRQWGIELGMVSRCVSFYDFKTSFERERNVENAINLAYAFAKLKFSVNRSFLESNYFTDIAAVSAEFCDADLHIALLCLIQGIDGTTMNCYVDKYVAKVLSVTKSRNMAPQLLSLCEATMFKYQVPGRTAAFVSDIQKSLDDSFAKRLVEYYKPSLEDQVSDYSDSDRYDKDAQKKLLIMLRDAGEKAVPKGLSGFFNNLFGKK